MNNLTLQETEKLTNRSFSELLELYLTGEIPEPLIFPDGTYRWPLQSIAKLIKKPKDHDPDDAQNSSKDLKAFIYNHFGISLPISGGWGDTQNTAIQIHSKSPNVHVQVEYRIIRCFAKMNREKYKFVQQTLYDDSAHVFDKIDIAVKSETNETYHKYFYFDITEAFLDVPTMFRA
jgi:hypothetical protein